MPRPRIELNHGGMQEVLRSSGVQRALDDKAKQIAATARALAPVATGAYRDSIKAERAPTRSRARARVVATDWKAAIIEADDRVLGRALEGSGGTPDPTDLVSYTTKAGRQRMATRAQVANWTRGSR